MNGEMSIDPNYKLNTIPNIKTARPFVELDNFFLTSRGKKRIKGNCIPSIKCTTDLKVCFYYKNSLVYRLTRTERLTTELHEFGFDRVGLVVKWKGYIFVSREIDFYTRKKKWSPSPNDTQNEQQLS